MAQSGASEEMDESLYSRQLYVLGHEGMRRMATSNILVSGMRGLIAKNVVLGGVKSVTIHDIENASWMDLSSQSYLNEAHLGKGRAVVTQPQIAELNNYEAVSAYTRALTEEYLGQFQVVCLSNSSLDEQLRVGEFCHNKRIKFVVADTKGLFGEIFCDFGADFVVNDVDGEPPNSTMVASVTKDIDGIVASVDDTRHGFEDGDHVKFHEIKGMTGLNECEPRKIKVLGPYTFSIGDTSGLSDNVCGGFVTKVKMPKTLHFKSLKEAIAAPQLLPTDFAKFDRSGQLHLAFQALSEYKKQNGSLPKPRNKVDAEAFLTLFKQLNAKSACKMDEIDEKLWKEFAEESQGDLCPMAAIIGGVSAQEIMKSLHLEYFVAAANFSAFMYGLKQVNDRNAVKEIVSKIVIKKFVPKSGVKIDVTDAEAQSRQNEYVDNDQMPQMETLLGSIPPPEYFKGVTLTPIELEKDDDSNYHMDFIVSTSNLRADNYDIPSADRHKSKLIAGRIIPAIATTTAMVVGLVGLELFKLAQGHKNVEKFKNGFANLALPFFVLSEPIWPLRTKFSLSAIQEKHNLEITMLSQGVCMLYSFFMQPAKREERPSLLMSEVVKKVSKKIPAHVRALVLEICCNDKEGEDGEVPYVKYDLPR